MPKYSIFMRVQIPPVTPFPRPNAHTTIASLVAQTQEDWELRVVGTQEELDWLGPQDPRVIPVLAPADEPLAWLANRLLPTLGTWIGFLTEADVLEPNALAQFDAGQQAQSQVRVWYANEEWYNWFDQRSMTTGKGSFDPLRLRHQDYLGAMSLVQRSLLEAQGGFDRLSNRDPLHSCYLRTFETNGGAAFGHLPAVLLRRYRDHRVRLPGVNYDPQAVASHLERTQVPVLQRQLAGRIDLAYRYPDHPTVTVLVVVDDDLEEGLRRIQASQLGPVYRPAEFRILYVGTAQASLDQYKAWASNYRLKLAIATGSVPAALNFEARRVDSALVCFLQGEPLNPRWLHQLVDHARLAGTGAVGARCLVGRRLHQPGHCYDGWDWNAAGRLEALTVPHQTAAVHSGCLLVDLRLFLQFDGFDTRYPTAYALELCLQLDAAGQVNWSVPGSQVAVEPSLASGEEAALLQGSWPGWVDRFGLQTLQL